MIIAGIDWENPDQMISKYFSVKEALFLPSWGRLANRGDGFEEKIASAIVAFARLDMDRVREFIGLPIHVHCWYRPLKYNQELHGATHSAHMCEDGFSAVDWHADVEGTSSRGESCDTLRASLMPILGLYGIRMEDNGQGAPWIHLDNAPVKVSRYFKP